MTSRLLWAVLPGLLVATTADAQVRREKFTAGARYLIVEILDDDLVHVEASTGTAPALTLPLATSPMVAKSDYAGPSSYTRSGNVLRTPALQLQVEPSTLCVAATERVHNRSLTRICPADLESSWKGLSIAKQQIKAVYGLGQQFKTLGSADGDWLQHGVREEQPQGQEQEHGNGFMPFGPAGMVGNVQVPVMYAIGDQRLNYAILLDNVYKQRWDFRGDPWQVRMWGDQVRFFLMAGPDLPDLRADYMELTGRPPVPPRKAFGLWVSEFGYRNWPQVDTLRAGLRADKFPLDGFVLDLQWFGGVTPQSADSRMGTLDWDQSATDGNGFFFPSPAANAAFLAADDVGLAAIEESYVSEHTQTFGAMRATGPLFAYQPDASDHCDPAAGAPAILSEWFGRAAMIDWSNANAGEWVHEQRRFANLSQNGVTVHWTDLGEPEKYARNACYHGVETTAAGPKNRHGDIHNLYAFLWNRSLYDGYVRHNPSFNRRPFILSRSGAAGSQRFGVAMWSGDIGSNLSLLATHLNAQMHMSFSGIDFYGADIGGFRREGIPYNEQHSGRLQYQDELYTQWLANGAWFDVPVRPHTDNTFQASKRYETAPNLVGVKSSNLANLRQRYELIPYYYSLAYRAHLAGEPIAPPLVFYYQDDPQVRQIGHEKLIGRDLLVGVVASHGEYQRNIYLPAGRWANYHTRDWIDSAGQWLNEFPTYIDGVLRLPAFARAGAILPMMRVDDQTKDAFGHRLDGTSNNDLILQVFGGPARTSFTLYDDDGVSLAFDAQGRPQYQTRTTEVSQQMSGQTATITIAAAAGGFPGAADRRRSIVRLVTDGARAAAVTLNSAPLAEVPSRTAFDAADSGWFNAGRNLVLMKSREADVSVATTFSVQLAAAEAGVTLNFACANSWTALGEDIAVVGNINELGAWDPLKGVRLSPSVYYAYIYDPPPGHNGPGPSTPTWTGVVTGLPSGAAVEWKCVKRSSSGSPVFEPGANHQIMLPARGFAGTVKGAF